MNNQATNNGNNNHYDIAIIGAGLVGTTLLAMIMSNIKDNNLKIAIIDKQAVSTAAKIDLASKSRTTALNYNTKCIYEELGIWQYFTGKTTNIDQVVVTEELNASCCFSAAKEQVPHLGYIVEHNELQQVLRSYLLQLVKSYKNITLLEKQNVEKLCHRQHNMEINLANNKIVTANLAVIADGGNSQIINHLGIYYQTTDYQQTAIVCHAELNHPNNNIAYEYFADSASIALLPYKKIKAGVVWAIPNNKLDYFKTITNEHFVSNLQEQFGNKLQVSFKSIADRFYYPMKMNLATEQVAPNLVVLGSAAHFIHPVAAQGYNLSVKCCELLLKNLQVSLQQQVNIGDLNRLLEYKKVAIKQQQPIISFCDYTVKAFSLKCKPVKYLCSMTLNCLDKLKPAKSYFANKAMGL